MAIVGGAIALGGLISGIITRNNAKKRLKELEKQDPEYQISPYAKQRLALAQTTLNSRAAGAAQAERNIFQTQANTIGAANRNATDSSQALSVAAASQGQTNDSFEQLAAMEAQAGEARKDQLYAAQDVMTAENDKDYDNKVRHWQDRVNIVMGKNALSQQNAQSLANFGGTASGVYDALKTK